MRPVRWPNCIPHSRVRSARRDNLRGCRRRNISNHAPRVGSDADTLSSPRFLIISIHAPRVGSDPNANHVWGRYLNFNPRSPCGERRDCMSYLRRRRSFQSTLPVCGATCHHAGRQNALLYFNPRSPCGERPRFAGAVATAVYFNPRSPCGERPSSGQRFRSVPGFQSTLPVWGATRPRAPLLTSC